MFGKTGHGSQGGTGIGATGKSKRKKQQRRDRLFLRACHAKGSTQQTWKRGDEDEKKRGKEWLPRGDCLQPQSTDRNVPLLQNPNFSTQADQKRIDAGNRSDGQGGRGPLISQTHKRMVVLCESLGRAQLAPKNFCGTKREMRGPIEGEKQPARNNKKKEESRVKKGRTRRGKKKKDPLGGRHGGDRGTIVYPRRNQKKNQNFFQGEDLS